MKPSKIQRLSAIACLCGALVSIAGCAVNPATGRSDLIVVSEGRERSIGRREHPKIVKDLVADLAKAIHDGRTNPGPKQANDGHPDTFHARILTAYPALKP